MSTPSAPASRRWSAVAEAVAAQGYSGPAPGNPRTRGRDHRRPRCRHCNPKGNCVITVLTCRGTGEPLGSPENLLVSVTSRLDPTKYEIGPDVDYPASIGPANPQNSAAGCSEQQSIDQGMRALVAAIHRSPNKVGLLGYSLGAEVVTRFLEAKARGEYPDCEVAWAANVANPLRVAGDSIDPNPVGFGINGQHGLWPGRSRLGRSPIRMTASPPVPWIRRCALSPTP